MPHPEVRTIFRLIPPLTHPFPLEGDKTALT